jgi:hypothetical protein
MEGIPTQEYPLINLPRGPFHGSYQRNTIAMEMSDNSFTKPKMTATLIFLKPASQIATNKYEAACVISRKSAMEIVSRSQWDP